MIDKDTQAEIEAIHMEIRELKQQLNNLAAVINNNKDVIHELIGHLNARDRALEAL